MLFEAERCKPLADDEEVSSLLLFRFRVADRVQEEKGLSDAIDQLIYHLESLSLFHCVIGAQSVCTTCVSL